MANASPGSVDNVLIVAARVPTAEVQSLWGGPVDPETGKNDGM